MLIFSLASLAIAAGFAIFSYLKIPAWQSRSFGDRSFKWSWVIGASTAVSLGASHLAYWLSEGSLFSSLTVGIVGYLLVLASVTDFALMKIPSETTTLAQWIAVPAIIWLWPSLTFDDKISLGFWFGIVAVFAVLSFLRMFGWADVKLMFAFGTLLAWWVGPLNMMLAFLGSSVLALLMMPILKATGMTVKKTTDEVTVWNAKTKQMEAQHYEDTATVLPAETGEAAQEQHSEPGDTVSEKPRKKRKRTYVPFGPALLISFTAMALITSATGTINHYGWGQENPMPEGFCFVLAEGSDPADYEGLTICPE